MSQQNEKMSDENQGRVQVNNLPQQEEGLKSDEARNVKGGGGASGGVLGDRTHIGEEIPQ
jgi:hypothetical protein